jgi:hypothetical protein
MEKVNVEYKHNFTLLLFDDKLYFNQENIDTVHLKYLKIIINFAYKFSIKHKIKDINENFEC